MRKVVTVFLVGLLILIAITLSLGLYDAVYSQIIFRRPETFLERINREFDLPRVMEYFDRTVDAIEGYYQDHNTYPASLESLVPGYLQTAPTIVIAQGEQMEYAPRPERDEAAPFTFYLYGHYSGAASMHGWALKYCPAELGNCGETDDRHFHFYRINNRWIWMSYSAL